MPDFIWFIIIISISVIALWISFRANYRTKKNRKTWIYLIHKIDETFIISIVDFTIAQNFKINELKNEGVFKSEEE